MSIMKLHKSSRRFKAISVILAVIALMIASGSGNAQRRINPVQNPTNTPIPINENRSQNDTIDRSRLVEMTDARGNIIMVDTITGTEWVDTLGGPNVKIPKMEYPLLYSASVSADFFTPLMRAFGQHWGLFEVGAELNLHNRYIPVFEFGMGKADNTPEGNNYTYTSPTAPFFRLGMNYNFFYNSNPNYMVFAGFRYGFTPFQFTVKDVHIDNTYWGIDKTLDFPTQKMTAGYLDLLLGLKVKIISNFSLGWTVRYRFMLHQSACPYGEPWYVPGFGSKTAVLGATFSLSYTFPFRHKKADTNPDSESALSGSKTH